MEASELRALELMLLRRGIEERQAENALRQAASLSRQADRRFSFALSEFERAYKAITEPKLQNSAPTSKSAASIQPVLVKNFKLREGNYRYLLEKREQVRREKVELKSAKQCEFEKLSALHRTKKMKDKLDSHLKIVSGRIALEKESIRQEEFEAAHTILNRPENGVNIYSVNAPDKLEEKSVGVEEPEREIELDKPAEEGESAELPSYSNQLEQVIRAERGVGISSQGGEQGEKRSFGFVSSESLDLSQKYSARNIAERIGKLFKCTGGSEVGVSFSFISRSGNSYEVSIKTAEKRTVLLIEIESDVKERAGTIREIKAELSQAFYQAGIKVRSLQFTLTQRLNQNRGVSSWNS